MNATANAAIQRKPKRTLLPILIVLFLISYCLLTKLVFEQDRTIDSQNSLIHELFRDNIHLSAVPDDRTGQLSQKPGAHSRARIEAPSSPVQPLPSIEVPFAQVPLTRVPSAQVQVPSNARPQANAKADRKSRKAKKQLPRTPPAELTDPSDMRRVSFSI
jgi:hypothetical protein